MKEHRGLSVLDNKSRGCDDQFMLIVLLLSTWPVTSELIRICKKRRQLCM